jgi:hypothetical protein
MTINELQEQLQENLITYLDELHPELKDGVCQVIVETFDTAFFKGEN